MQSHGRSSAADSAPPPSSMPPASPPRSSGSLNIKPIIGGQCPLQQWHDAFDKMHRGEVVKSVLIPN